MSAPLRIAFVTLDRGAASARVRVLDHLPGLAAAGIAGELRELPRGFLARRRAWRDLAGHDAVVLHRVLLAELDLAALRRRARALALDLDDAIELRPHRAHPSRRLARRLTLALAACDLVLAGSAHLRDRLRGRHPRVRLLPPASPPAQATRDARPDAAPVRLVWTGSRSTLPYLEALDGVLAEVAAARPGRVALEVLADAPPALPTSAAAGLGLGFTPWSLEAEERALARAAVGLYPLFDDAWSAGKCGYKLRRYMAHGLPSVASPQGGGREALAPPDAEPAGLLAEGPAQWREALLRLIDEPPLRRSLGRRALALALGREALGDRTRTLARILRELSAIGRARVGAQS